MSLMTLQRGIERIIRFVSVISVSRDCRYKQRC
jgi:hypothetical protein